nr:PREDICTED: dedicator of cytokinesis protein 3-like isoform X2 [Latimeria chalumnae]|eukprot:XP_014341966.1 PREDICTED: dedicator of cytokinesis protein 3-like isoform X2 [Latimeria chalumnae]
MRPLHKKLIEQFQMMRSSLCHELPALDKISPACSGSSTPRGNLIVTHSPMSPETIKLVHRHSPLNLLGSIRHSSSSLSSHTSSETGNLIILTDGLVGETSDDIFRMQVSPSTSSLSSTQSAPSQMINSAPSSARGSPSLPDKYRHSRELVMLLPPHRDRPSSAMYPVAMMENGQPMNFQRALIQQVIGPCKPCSDPNLSVAEKAVPTAPSSWSLDSGTRDGMPFLSTHAGSVIAPPVPPRSLPPGHYSLHFDAFHHQMSDIPPALPARTLRKSPLHPIPASPTSPHSGLDGSNSTLSGSASSGVSSLSESNFGQSSEAPPRTDTMDSVPSQTWNTDEDLETPYLPVRYSLSEPDVVESVKTQPCRSHSAPTGVIHQETTEPPALPPKPYHSRPPRPESEDAGIDEEVRPRSVQRKLSQVTVSIKEDQAKVAWEHGISEE